MTGKTAGRPDSGDWNKYIAYMDAQLAELLGGEYGQIGGIWFDGWWDQQTKRVEGNEERRSAGDERSIGTCGGRTT